MATIDVLGEEITHADEARAIAHTYEDVFRTIAVRELDANVSVKPTALGLSLGYDIFRANLEHVVQLAAVIGNFVRIDMEDSSTTDDTLRAYRELREAGHENVGVVLQACLRRTVDDIAALAELGLNIRLCKGIYVEPEEIAYTGFRGDPRELRARARGAARRRTRTWASRRTTTGSSPRRSASSAGAGSTPDEYEFQMLLGVRPGAGRRARRRGPPAAHLRAVRQPVVRVLDAAAAGEPEDRRLHRRRHARAADPGPQRALRRSY